MKEVYERAREQRRNWNRGRRARADIRVHYERRLQAHSSACQVPNRRRLRGDPLTDANRRAVRNAPIYGRPSSAISRAHQSAAERARVASQLELCVECVLRFSALRNPFRVSRALAKSRPERRMWIAARVRVSGHTISLRNPK